MSDAQSKTRVLDTLKYLSNCQLLPEPRLYNELKQYLEQMEDESFQQNSESIDASCNLLKTITKTSVDNDRKQSLMDEFKRESEFLSRSLRIYTKDKQYPYTPLQILLKLELLFDPILDHSKICHDTHSELSKSIIKTADEQRIESIILVQNKNRPMLLRELTNAPLDDIIMYLQKYNIKFYDFYNYDRITYVVFRLRNLSSRAQQSINVYDKLCFFIDSELKEKYKLDMETIIQLLLDQFEWIDEGRYRKKLIDFVDHVYSKAYTIHKAENPESSMTSFYDRFDKPPFTFVQFFDYIQEDPVLTETDQSTFTTLFEIYCKKLAKILPSAPPQTPSQSPISCPSDDSESMKNAAGNRGRNKQFRKNNRPMAAKKEKLPRNKVTGNRRFQNTEDNDYDGQNYSSTTIHGYPLDEYYMPKPNSLRYHEKRNYSDNAYTHQPRRRVNRQQERIDENF